VYAPNPDHAQCNHSRDTVRKVREDLAMLANFLDKSERRAEAIIAWRLVNRLHEISRRRPHRLP
jgi:hypothetical protein